MIIQIPFSGFYNSIHESKINVINQMKRDKRFQINQEFCGYKQAQYVLRFCNGFVGCKPTLNEAWDLAHDWNMRRIGIYA